MTINELSAKYKIDIEKLKLFQDNNIITLSDNIDDDKLKRLGTICALYDIGFDSDDIKLFVKYCNEGRKAEQIKILNKYRFALLDSIHQKQKELDMIDYIIYQINNKCSRRISYEDENF